MKAADLFEGILLGTAVGDALGLPAEGLTPARQSRLFPGPLRHRLLFRRGLLSDDTEHALFVAQALLAEPRDPLRFQRLLAWKLRGWLLGLPAGVGLATLRATLKLCVGVPPSRSGVFSAGNGPAMRSALLGAYFNGDPERLRAFVRASTRLTHTDPKAEVAALAIAIGAAWSVSGSSDVESLFAGLRGLGPGDPEWLSAVDAIATGLVRMALVSEVVADLGLSRGVTGYSYHTVPVALYAWLRHRGDFRATIEAAVRAGGDTDTVAAITGALAGATTGAAGIPAEWIDGIVDWPRTTGVLRRIGERLASSHDEPTAGPVAYFWPGLALRNAVFLAVILFHGFRRLFPPYG